MEWSSPFIIYRITPEGKLEEVFHAADLKMAKYWLTYIAQNGDLLCRTPAHPKHSKKSSNPEYWQHRSLKGLPMQKEDEWKEFAKTRNFTFVYPEEQERVPEPT